MACYEQVVVVLGVTAYIANLSASETNDQNLPWFRVAYHPTSSLHSFSLSYNFHNKEQLW